MIATFLLYAARLTMILALTPNPFPTVTFNVTQPVVSGGGGGGTVSGGGVVGGGPITSGGSGGTGHFPQYPGMVTHHPSVIYFVGSGYDILKGNPDGEFWNKAGDDPGLLTTRKILLVNQVVAGNPPQLEINHRDSCHMSHEYNFIYSEKSYQDRLREAITTSGDADLALKDYAFTLSTGTKAIQTQLNTHHYVFQDYTTNCNMGHVRFKLDLARSDHFVVTREFAAAVCLLPVRYDEATYMNFIDQWGTHMITELEVGKKTTYRYQAKLSDYINFLLANASSEVSVGGPMDGYQKSYVVNMESFKYRQEYRYLAGVYQDTMVAGDMYWNDEIELVMTTLDSALKTELWVDLPMLIQQGVCPRQAPADLGIWRNNLIIALKSYPTFKGVTKPTDTELAMPITWPRGTYALPKPKSGCPGHFTWSEGQRHQATRYESHHSSWSPQNHFDAVLHNDGLTLRFCVKELSTVSYNDMNWPSGDYCIYQFGQCPPYFNQGSIRFDDEDTGSIYNSNSKNGTLPEGVYNSDTQYNYCCRSDSSYLSPIIMPTDKPFYLFKHKHGCQRVRGTIFKEETITWDNDINNGNTTAFLGFDHPAALKLSNQTSVKITVTFCYYSTVSTEPVVG